MLMMMMLDYVNLRVEYVIMSVPILSHKDNYYHFIPSDYVYIGGGGDRYVCIYIYIYIGTIRFSCCHAIIFSLSLYICICHVVAIYYVPNGNNIVSRGVGVCLWHLISKLSYIGIACNEDAVNLWTDLKLQLQLQLQLLKAKTKTITYLTIFTGMYIGPLRRLAVSLLLQV